MSILAGYPPEGRDRAVLNLAAMLARSAGDDLLVCTVVPAPWFPSPARIDAEYQAYLDDVANQALDRARAELPADVSATYSMHRSRSAPSGLLESTKPSMSIAITRNDPASARTLGRKEAFVPPSP